MCEKVQMWASALSSSENLGAAFKAGLKQELEWRQINHRSRAETATSTQNTFDQNARIDRQLLP